MLKFLTKISFALGLCAVTTVAFPSHAISQTLSGIQSSTSPLVLKSRGSFMVGGEGKNLTAGQLSSIYAAPPTSGGNISVNQMYVEFMVPDRANGLPVVMVHGATLSGKTFDTTPDGRMGWYEYFVRQGHPVYVADQVSRGRSGSDFSIYNDVRAGERPATELPNVFRISDQLGWTMFRFGPAFGQAFPDEQFPIDAIRELSCQAIPDLNAVLADPNQTAHAMADLAAQLKGAVLLGHSESGVFPLEAALNAPNGIHGLVLVEPGSCLANTWTEKEIAVFKRIPILTVFGDHLDAQTGTPGFSWKDAYNNCQKFVSLVNATGGKAKMLHLPEQGLHGNSHMMMMDKNNLRVADLLLDWIKKTVTK
ncbi:MAG: hypothetical protein ACO1RX_08825 [Candidatus Sericytochromatia bacterium]